LSKLFIINSVHGFTLINDSIIFFILTAAKTA
jgi:hypothetical protein